jgi:hypothetical protein
VHVVVVASEVPWLSAGGAGLPSPRASTSEVMAHACGQVGEVRFLTRERVREFPHIQPGVGLKVSWRLGSSVVAGSGEAGERGRFPDMKNPKKGFTGN